MFEDVKIAYDGPIFHYLHRQMLPFPLISNVSSIFLHIFLVTISYVFLLSKFRNCFSPKCLVSLTSLKCFTILAAIYFWTFSPIFNSVYHLDSDFAPWILPFSISIPTHHSQILLLHSSSAVDC